MRKALSDYGEILTTYSDGKARTNAITVIITGDRSAQMFAGEKIRYAALDGSLDYLDSNLPPRIRALDQQQLDSDVRVGRTQ